MCGVNDDRLARAEEYREIAEGIRELARRSRFHELTEQLYDLAYSYDRIADNLKLEKFGSVSRAPVAGSRVFRASDPSEPKRIPCINDRIRALKARLSERIRGGPK